MFSRGWVFLKPSLTGGFSKSEIERAITVLEKEDSNLKSIIMDLHRLLSEELFRTGQMETGLFLIEKNLLQILAKIMSNQTDPLILKAAFMLVWDLSNPLAFGSVTQGSSADNFIAGLFILSHHEIRSLRTAGFSGIERMADLFPEKAKQLSIRLCQAAPTLPKIPLLEQNSLLRITTILVKRDIELWRLEEIVRYATTFKPTPPSPPSTKDKIEWSELYDAAVQLVTAWNLQNAPTLPKMTRPSLRRAPSESADEMQAQAAQSASQPTSQTSLDRTASTSQESLTEAEEEPEDDEPTYATTNTLAYVSRSMSNPTAFVFLQNIIEQKNEVNETLTLGPKMTTGVHRLTLKSVGEATQLHRIGILDARKGIPPSGDWLTHNSRGYGYCSALGRIRDKDNGNVDPVADKLKKDSLVTVEIDLRPGGERSVHFFVNGKQQKAYIMHAPRTCQFAITLWPRQQWEFVSLESYLPQAAPHIAGEVPTIW